MDINKDVYIVQTSVFHVYGCHLYNFMKISIKSSHKAQCRVIIYCSRMKYLILIATLMLVAQGFTRTIGHLQRHSETKNKLEERGEDSGRDMKF
jgi:hypothetical protein